MQPQKITKTGAHIGVTRRELDIIQKALDKDPEAKRSLSVECKLILEEITIAREAYVHRVATETSRASANGESDH